ncbi:unnamed protein product [Adineta ricciae]|uniref:Uncharacterized protein n=1 Tax=Adineta ricciae TaxID=249248 RepID=A0A815KQ46_ADIRI|nr:unnamed protein product [Adineta ricciae]CAF1634585.1 unnamed protein product [Adineta ricciae]
MFSSLSSCRPSILLASVLRSPTTRSISKRSDEDAESQQRLSVTKKMRLLGLQSNQARKALSIYDDYVHRQKKLPDLRMFAVAINCAMIAEDLAKGCEIHQFIEKDFPHLKDNLMLKQQLRYFYIKCNDQQSADKLFQQTSTKPQESQNTISQDLGVTNKKQ